MSARLCRLLSRGGWGAWVALGVLGAAAEKLDYIVAVVDGDVITASQMMAETRLALAMRAGDEAASVPLSPALNKELSHFVLHQHLIASQLRRQGGTEVTESEMAARFAALRSRFASDARYHRFLQHFGIEPAVVENIVRRDAQNDRFVTQRLRARVVGIASSSPAQSQARMEQALQEWLAQLTKTVEVRVLGPGRTLELQRP